MKFFDIDTELNFGKYEGKTLKQVALIDPKYINEIAITNPTFFISAPVITDLQELQPDLHIDSIALDSLYEKHKNWQIKLGIFDEEENEDPYAIFDEESWKEEFGLSYDDDTDDLLSLEAASLEAEANGEFPGFSKSQKLDNTEDLDIINKPKTTSFEDEPIDAIDDMPFDRFDEDIDDWDGEDNFDENIKANNLSDYDNYDEWN